MLRRGQTTMFQERLDMSERAAAGQSDSESATTLGCWVWTVRKWRRRGQRQGRTGLSSERGRPITGPLGTLPVGMRQALGQMRRAHPGWGPTTLLAELRVDPRWVDHPLPSRSRIAALLSAEKLTRRYQKHSELPTPASQEEAAPHDEWELDAQGSIQALGIEVCFTRKRCPTDHAKIERTHQTMTLQALLGQEWPGQAALWAGLDARRAMLNQHSPSGVLQGRAPLPAYPQAAHSGRFYRPEWEAQLLDLDRVFAYPATCRWFRRIRANGRLDLGGYDYYLGMYLRNQMLEVHFDVAQGCFLGQLAGSETTVTFTPKGLTPSDLMEELAHLLALPVYQLALPFTQEVWRKLAYTQTLTGTIL